MYIALNLKGVETVHDIETQVIIDYTINGYQDVKLKYQKEL